MAKPVEHRFGGRWTELKLSAVSYYSEFYTKALSKQRFDLWYIDAFAGTGDRTEAQISGGLFEGAPLAVEDVTIDGSARRAMAVTPPFKHLIFMEPDATRYAALRVLADQDDRVECMQGDANRLLPEIFKRTDWRRGGQRGIVFLDPYGMQVESSTLEALAATKRVDVWYLFPLWIVNRQLARNASGIDAGKEAALDRIFGGRSWRTELYAPRPKTDLFDLPSPDGRTVSLKDVERYAWSKLSDVFAWCSEPLPLYGGSRQQLYSLFLCLANDASPAIALARRVMADLLKRHGASASRHTSDL